MNDERDARAKETANAKQLQSDLEVKLSNTLDEIGRSEKQLSKLQQELEQQREAFKAAEKDKQALGTQLDGASAKIVTLTKSIEQQQERIMKLEIESGEWRDKCRIADESLVLKQQHLSDTEERVAELRTKLLVHEQQLAKMSDEQNESEQKLNAATEREAAQQKRISELQREIETITKNKNDVQLEFDNAVERCDELQKVRK